MEDFSTYEIRQIIENAKIAYKEARSHQSLLIEATELIDEVCLLEKYFNEYLKLHQEIANSYSNYYNGLSKTLKKAVLNDEPNSLLLINNTANNFKNSQKFDRRENFKILISCSKENIINQTKELNNKLSKMNAKNIKRKIDIDRCNHNFLIEFTNNILENQLYITNEKDPKVMMVCCKCGAKFVDRLSKLDTNKNEILTISKTFLDINNVDIDGAIELLTSDYQKLSNKYNELGISEKDTITDFIGDHVQRMRDAQKQFNNKK